MLSVFFVVFLSIRARRAARSLVIAGSLVLARHPRRVQVHSSNEDQREFAFSTLGDSAYQLLPAKSFRDVASDFELQPPTPADFGVMAPRYAQLGILDFSSVMTHLTAASAMDVEPKHILGSCRMCGRSPSRSHATQRSFGGWRAWP